MRDSLQSRSSEAEKKSLRERAAFKTIESIEPTERDPLLARKKAVGSIKRRHQSPTLKHIPNPSMAKSQTGPYLSGKHTSTTSPSFRQNAYIPPLPGREQNVLHDSNDSYYDDASNRTDLLSMNRKSHDKQEYDDHFRQQYYNERAARLLGDSASEDGNSTSVVEVSDEVYTIRKAALTVMEPLVYTSVSFDFENDEKHIGDRFFFEPLFHVLQNTLSFCLSYICICSLSQNVLFILNKANFFSRDFFECCIGIISWNKSTPRNLILVNSSSAVVVSPGHVYMSHNVSKSTLCIYRNSK